MNASFRIEQPVTSESAGLMTPQILEILHNTQETADDAKEIAENRVQLLYYSGEDNIDGKSFQWGIWRSNQVNFQYPVARCHLDPGKYLGIINLTYNTRGGTEATCNFFLTYNDVQLTQPQQMALTTGRVPLAVIFPFDVGYEGTLKLIMSWEQSQEVRVIKPANCIALVKVG